MVAAERKKSIYQNARLFLAAFVFPLILSNCTATTGGYIETGYTKVSQLQEADRLFDKGQYQTALLKYSAYVFAPFSDKQNEDYALYKMGLCQFLVGQYSDAQKTARNVIQSYPNFQYIEKARELLARSEEKIAESNKVATAQWKDLQQRVSRQEQLVAQDPQNAGYQFQLGDLYWDAGRFTDAVKRYEKSVQFDKSYLEKKTLRDRVRITQDGQFRVRDPLYENMQKPSAIQVVDARREELKRGDVLGNYEAVRVSGYVENTGLYDVNNVRVEIAVYDFNNTIQETQVVPVGELRAGGKRPFSALFNQFRERSSDITRYTTEVFYDEPPAFK